MSDDVRREVTWEQSLLCFLKSVRNRPAMYLRERSATNLEQFNSGWQSCLIGLGLKDRFYEEFEGWLDTEKHGNVQGTHAIYWKTQELGDERALEWFFECFDEYIEKMNYEIQGFE